MLCQIYKRRLKDEQMNLKFNCKVTVVNNKIQFPDSTVTKVVVCMHDAYTSQVLDVVNGVFKVNFKLKSRDGYALVPMNDTLKFHMYTGTPVSRLAAGWVDLPVLLQTLAGGQVYHSDICCNFTTHTFKMEFSTDSSSHMVEALDVWQQAITVPSCLRNSGDMVEHFQNLSQHVTMSLKSNVKINIENGGVMFSNLCTAHTMEGEATLHTQFQADMALHIQGANLLHNSGLTMLAVASTLQLYGLTCEDALTKLPGFMASACQFAQTSAHLMPYQSDMGLGNELDVMGQAMLVSSEDFKRPFTEPFQYTEGVVGAIFCDDCEGMATEIHHMYSSFKYLWTAYKAEWVAMKSGNAFAQILNRDKLITFMAGFFPSSLFDMSLENKAKIFDLAMNMGKAADCGDVQCSLALISASAQALGDANKAQLAGHCCVVFTDSTNREYPVSILAEGTNCMTVDPNYAVVSVKTPEGIKQVPFSEIVNGVSMDLLRGAKQTDERVMMHLAGLTGNPVPFYKTLFCQGNALMATKTDDVLHYGLDICNLSDEASKVFMPIDMDHLPELVRHCEDRRHEIHAPLITVESLAAALSACSPVTMFESIPVLQGRTFTNCMLAHAARTLDDRNAILKQAQSQAEAFNNSDHINLGYMRVYAAMDSVYTILSVWTDKTDCLKTLLQNSFMCLRDVHVERGVGS